MLQYVKERFTNILPVGSEKGAGEEEVRNVVPPGCLKRYAKSAEKGSNFLNQKTGGKSFDLAPSVKFFAPCQMPPEAP